MSRRLLSAHLLQSSAPRLGSGQALEQGFDFSAIDPDCFGKTAYPSRQAAETQRARYIRRGAGGGARGCHAYRCRGCGQWHIAGSRRVR